MSKENVEVVKEHFTHDVDYRAAEDAPDDRGSIRGEDALRAWLRDWIDMSTGSGWSWWN